MRTGFRTAAAGTISVWIMFLCAASAWAQAVDYSGDWFIDKAQSEIPGTGIVDVLLAIEHRGTALSFKRTLVLQGGGMGVLEFMARIDGPAVKVKGKYVDELTVSCRYENGRLVIQREQDGIRVAGGKTQVILANVKEVYSLSADRQALTITETSTSGNSSRTGKMVFRRRK